MGKTIVIGLDGANWGLIEPWINEGELPNLKYLQENGSWGDSISQFPTVTCPNWKCYSTGKNPAKLGVFWWKRVDREKKKLVGYNSRSFKSLEIFDYISKAGLRVGVINMPTTYPPKALNGFMISGPPDSAYSGWVLPESLEDDLKKKYNYRVYPKVHISSRDDIENYLDDILYVMDMRFRVARDLLDSVDFLHMSIFYINVLHHFFYDEEPVKQGWKLIDRNIGEFLKEDHNIILMSDHGTHEVDTVFYINTWLEKEGYLRIKRSYLLNLYKIGITKERLVRLANMLGMVNFVKKVFPEKIIRSIPSEEGTMSGRVSMLEDKIDWDNSKVLGTGQGTVYLLIRGGSDEYEELRDEVIKKLSKVAYKNGRKAAEVVYKKEDVYSGKYLDMAPDIVYEQGAHVYSASGLGKENYFDTSHKWRADNLKEGIFLAYGHDIKKGETFDGIRIVDIAPTILHTMGVPVPKDMDGRVLKEIFENDSELAKRNIIYQEIGDGKDTIAKKIKGLKKSENI